LFDALLVKKAGGPREKLFNFPPLYETSLVKQLFLRRQLAQRKLWRRLNGGRQGHAIGLQCD